MKTFRELYCEHHGVAPEKFERTLVRQSLHWRARPFYWLLSLNRGYYSLDLEFARVVGELHSRRGYRDEAAEFINDRNNRGLLRGVLRFRVSTSRLQPIFEREIGPVTPIPPT